MRRRLWMILSLLAVGGLPGASVGRADAPVIAAWAAGPFEARIALDRPVGDEVARALVGRTIAFEVTGGGQAPKADDTRGSLRIAAARTTDGGRTFVLTTDPHSRAATYTLDL